MLKFASAALASLAAAQNIPELIESNTKNFSGDSEQENQDYNVEFTQYMG